MRDVARSIRSHSSPSTSAFRMPVVSATVTIVARYRFLDGSHAFRSLVISPSSRYSRRPSGFFGMSISGASSVCPHHRVSPRLQVAPPPAEPQHLPQSGELVRHREGAHLPCPLPLVLRDRRGGPLAHRELAPEGGQEARREDPRVFLQRSFTA